MSSVHRRYRILLGAVAMAALAGAFAVVGLARTSAGSPPPEYLLQTDSWPAHNYDLANSRATTHLVGDFVHLN
jgi:hypothetical protein